MKQTTILGTLKTTFGAAAIAAATVFALGSTASPAYADNPTTVSTAPGACSVGADCKLEVIVTAGTGLHVNAEYNHKVKMNATSGITYGKEQFSKEGGDHAFRGETVGVITVHYKAAAKGKVTLSGTYKYATCSEGKGGGCTPASATFSADVTVK